jgi:hypothetical protein
LKKNEAVIDRELSNVGVYAVKGLQAGINRLSQSISDKQKKDITASVINAALSNGNGNADENKSQ